MKQKLVPDSFTVPELLETRDFRLRMLTIHDVVKDYDAVMSSIEYLQNTRPLGPDHNWPTEDLTLEQNLVDLGWHQKEFQNRTSFAYTVMNHDESMCLGCVYIYPSANPNYDARVMMWVRQSEAAKGLDEVLIQSVKQWVLDEWPFARVAFPGRNFML